MKPMLLTSTNNIPLGKEWIYETKYDGFRCIVDWEEKTPTLKSRNGKVLNNQFPEIVSFCHELNDKVKSLLPISFDGELVYLTNNFKGDFSTVQMRGRMRKNTVINKHVEDYPCHYVVFDLLKYRGEDQTIYSLDKRKKKLEELFRTINLPESINYLDVKRIQAIDVYEVSDSLLKKVITYNGEGIVAKKKTSNWESDKRTVSWLKIKNWRYVDVVLTKFDKNNGFFDGAIYIGDSLVEVVTFRHGLKEEEIKTLSDLFQSKGNQTVQNVWSLEPSICVTIACIDFDGKHLREPRFHAFDFEIEPQDCHWHRMQRKLFPIPETVKITHPEKPVWPVIDIRKADYLLYLQKVSPFMLPFLRDRHLTAIRYPHGVIGEKFYQKNAPDYVPDFITTNQEGDIRYIVCNDIETLLWLGNQLVLEYHIPFQTTKTDYPTEIVFDLDPPSVKEFSLAVEAAIRMKAIFDKFSLQSFVKTSGGKGLQIYIPLPLDTFSYEDTRIFTKFVCDFLCEQEPRWFTIERLKKNRNNKLYLDYVQHHEGKTIVAPYSPRGNAEGLIATPLNWEEVTSTLIPDLFSIPAVLERITNVGNPFRNFHHVGEEQKFESVLNQLKELLK
jgi:bifunctional non-homologous end joining protein LigD